MGVSSSHLSKLDYEVWFMYRRLFGCIGSSFYSFLRRLSLDMRDWSPNGAVFETIFLPTNLKFSIFDLIMACFFLFRSRWKAARAALSAAIWKRCLPERCRSESYLCRLSSRFLNLLIWISFEMPIGCVNYWTDSLLIWSTESLLTNSPSFSSERVPRLSKPNPLSYYSSSSFLAVEPRYRPISFFWFLVFSFWNYLL